MTAAALHAPMSTGRTAWRLVRYRTGLFLGTILFRGIDDIVPFAIGLIGRGINGGIMGQIGRFT